MNPNFNERDSKDFFYFFGNSRVHIPILGSSGVAVGCYAKSWPQIAISGDGPLSRSIAGGLSMSLADLLGTSLLFLFLLPGILLLLNILMSRMCPKLLPIEFKGKWWEENKNKFLFILPGERIPLIKPWECKFHYLFPFNIPQTRPLPRRSIKRLVITELLLRG